METTSFTLFDIGPMVIKKEELPSVPQHCTRGHTWDVGLRLIGFRLNLSDFGLTDGPEEFCFLCLRDNLRESCGRVKDGPK